MIMHILTEPTSSSDNPMCVGPLTPVRMMRLTKLLSHLHPVLSEWLYTHLRFDSESVGHSTSCLGKDFFQLWIGELGFL